ncbi:hypothetical protein STEG23_032336 [Scotinomys teguina]
MEAASRKSRESMGKVVGPKWPLISEEFQEVEQLVLDQLYVQHIEELTRVAGGEGKPPKSTRALPAALEAQFLTPGDLLLPPTQYLSPPASSPSHFLGPKSTQAPLDQEVAPDPERPPPASQPKLISSCEQPQSLPRTQEHLDTVGPRDHPLPAVRQVSPPESGSRHFLRQKNSQPPLDQEEPDPDNSSTCKDPKEHLAPIGPREAVDTRNLPTLNGTRTPIRPKTTP